MRVVLDTNVIVSALLYGGKPKRIMDLATKGTILAITSEVLLKELASTLYRLSQKYQYNDFDIAAALQHIAAWSDIVEPKIPISALADDPDNRVLEAAVTGSCGWVITGDKRFLELGTYKDIKIVTVSNFLEELKHEK